MDALIFTYEGYEMTNIGDYIQSLAAKQYVKHNFIYYNRDSLNQYHGRDVKAIMNGWFTHKPQNWPPSENIHPLFVAFHINASVYKYLLSSKSIKYLKQFEPIGCRDINTANILKKNGVDAYFSSCLTTTLGYKYNYRGKRKGIYIVDPVHYVPEASSRFQKYKFIFYYIRYFNGINKYIKNIREHNNYYLSFNQQGINRYLCLIRSYILMRKILSKKDLDRAEIITQFHYCNEYPSNESRFNRAEELINKYAKAEFVITSRIHCALPCLGLETPVIFLQNAEDSKESTCRFDGLLELLNVIKFKRNNIIESPFKLPINIRSIQNKESYKAFRNDLIDKCTNFYK